MIAETFYKFATEMCSDELKQKFLENPVHPKTLEYTITNEQNPIRFAESYI